MFFLNKFFPYFFIKRLIKKYVRNFVAKTLLDAEIKVGMGYYAFDLSNSILFMRIFQASVFQW